MTNREAVAEATALFEHLQASGNAEGSSEQLAAIDSLLARAGGELPDLAVVPLLAARARILSHQGAERRAQEEVDLLFDRFKDSTELRVAHMVAYALMVKFKSLLRIGEIPAAVDAAYELLAAFERAPDDQNLTGLGLMLLDVSLDLMNFDQDREVVVIARALVDRLAAMNPSRQAVAAAGRFYLGLALGQTGGSIDEVETQMTMLTRAGEPGLVALERIVSQLDANHGEPMGYGLVALFRMVILMNLDRRAEAQHFAESLPAELVELFEDGSIPRGKEVLTEIRDDAAQRSAYVQCHMSHVVAPPPSRRRRDADPERSAE